MQRRIHALFLYLLLMFLEIAFSQTGEDHLPQPGECGTLNKTYMYNQKNITELDEFPWMARIAYRLNEGAESVYHCSATLISKYHLLTNANCFRFEEKAHAVLLGDWNAANNISEPDCDVSDKGANRCAPLPVLYEIDEIIVNLNYTPEIYANNVALLRLAKSVVYSAHIRPICLPGRDVAQLDFAAHHLTLTGWDKRITEEPRKTKKFVHIVGLQRCARINDIDFNKIFHNNSHLCAFGCNRVSQSRSTGSSALMGVAIVESEPSYYYLIGMIAYGRAYCSIKYPDLFTRVDGHLDWVRDNLHL